jgi:N-glycosylase/DNA lyase
MKIDLDNSTPFNLDATLCCGQTFRWEKQGRWYYGVVRDRVFKIRQLGRELEYEGVHFDFLKEYFSLDDDLQEIFHQIGKDKHIVAAITKFRGLRILRQDSWECLISYICATYKNIPAIKHMLSSLSRRFGKKMGFDGNEFYTFPTSERLAKATVDELRECGLGYRANYVLETSKMVCESNFDFYSLGELFYEQAKEELMGFPGVGEKVADCVLLFSLNKLEAFPVDVRIRRAILRYYASHFPKDFENRASSEKPMSRSEYEKLNRFGREYFGKYAGYAQEYLYHYERTQT